MEPAGKGWCEMKNADLFARDDLEVLSEGNADAPITGVYCCDLLSIVMSKAFEGAAWVTVMANINSIAVASLRDIACIILAEQVMPDETVLAKAKEQGITVLLSRKPVFDTALAVHQMLHNG